MQCADDKKQTQRNDNDESARWRNNLQYLISNL